MKPCTAATPEVLRGMHIESAPVRLRNRSDSDAPVDDGAQAQETALRERFDEAARAGREEGLRSGYEEGLRQGQRAAAQRLQEASEEAVRQARRSLQEEQERVRALLLGLATLPEECLRASEEEMVALCFDALCRMVGAGAVNVETVRTQVQHLVSLARPGQRLALHVHPLDAQLLRDCGAGLGHRVVADSEVVLGGAIVRSTGGSLDARMETMLEACKSTLLAALAARGGRPSGGAA